MLNAFREIQRKTSSVEVTIVCMGQEQAAIACINCDKMLVLNVKRILSADRQALFTPAVLI